MGRRGRGRANREALAGRIAEALSWDEARAAFDAGDLGDAELACVYVADRVRRAAGASWLQGPRRPALPCEGASPPVRLFAERELHKVPRAAPEALVAWAAGRRPVDLIFDVPEPRRVLALQARGRRCVSLLDDAVAASPEANPSPYHHDGLSFVLHDLCHLEKYVDPEHHDGQRGFFAALARALDDPRRAALERDLDAAWDADRDHVAADMNGSAVFLFVALKNRLKLAIRRRVARARGAPCGSGPLDDAERRAYAEASEALAALLGLDGPAADAARALESRRDGDEHARILLDHFRSAAPPV